MPRRHDRELTRAIGERVATLRRDRNLTQEQLALLADLEPLTISKCETGARALSIANLQLVARALGVTLSQLLDMGGVVPPARNDLVEQEWLALWRNMTAEQRTRALRIVRASL